MCYAHNNDMLIEEIAFQKTGVEVDLICEKMLSLLTISSKLEATNCSEERDVLVARLSTMIREEEVLTLFLDTENAKAKTSLIGKILGLIRRAVASLFSSLASYLAKVFSFVNLTLKKADKLASEITRNLYRYEDKAPQIRNSGAIVSIVEKNKLPDARRMNEILNSDLRKLSADHLITALMPSVSSMVSESFSGKPVNEILTGFAKRNDLTKDILSNRYKAQIKRTAKNIVYQYGIPTLPQRVSVTFTSTAPTVKVEKLNAKAGNMIAGYSPREAQSVISGVTAMLSFILDKDLGKKFKKEIDRLTSNLKSTSDTTPVKEVSKMIPQWVKFIRNFIKATVDYEYRICRAAFVAVKASKEKWVMTK